MSLAAFSNQFADWEAGEMPGAAPFGLDRTRRLLDLIGGPAGGMRIVHVAETKGKGSTATMLASMARAAGLRVGLYTSPHVRTPGERIAIDAQPVGNAALWPIISGRILPVIEGVPEALGQPTKFEVTTLIALRAFADARVDLSVLEVGLGGSLDATNTVDHVDIAVFTPISLDHTGILGDIVKLIARDKSGIIKQGSVVISAPQSQEAAREIAMRATAMGCPMFRVGHDIHVRRITTGGRVQRVRLRTRRHVIDALPPLAGAHQAINAATAGLAALTLLGRDEARESLAHGLWSDSRNKPNRPASEFERFPDRELARGLEQVQVPGRFEIAWERPLIAVDVAHNAVLALVLAETVREVFRRPVTYVVGMSVDKDHASFLTALTPTEALFVVVQAQHPRATPAGTLHSLASTETAIPTVLAADVVRGLDEALARSTPGTPVVVTGSFYTVAEALARLEAEIAPA